MKEPRMGEMVIDASCFASPRDETHRYQRVRIRANYSRTNHPDRLPTSICHGLSTSGESFRSGTSTVDGARGRARMGTTADVT